MLLSQAQLRIKRQLDVHNTGLGNLIELNFALLANVKIVTATGSLKRPGCATFKPIPETGCLN